MDSPPLGYGTRISHGRVGRTVHLSERTPTSAMSGSAMLGLAGQFTFGYDTKIRHVRLVEGQFTLRIGHQDKPCLTVHTAHLFYMFTVVYVQFPSPLFAGPTHSSNVRTTQRHTCLNLTASTQLNLSLQIGIYYKGRGQ